jgi:hypothetical protein
MLIREMEERDLETAYYDPTDDKYGVKKITDTRTKRLSLRHLNRLKKLRAVQELERVQQADLLSVMYGAPDAEAEGGAPGGMGF